MELLTTSFQCLAFLIYLRVSISQTNQPCLVDQFKMQENVTSNDFQGEWFVISIRNQWTAQNGQGLMDSDMRFRYTIASYGTINIETNLRTVLMGCMLLEGIAVSDPFSNMTKFTIISNNLAFRRHIFGNNNWIFRTDHKGFAVMYSCDYVRADGICDEAVVYTLNRNWNGHTQEEMRHIDETLASVCVHPSTLVPVVQNGECAFNNQVTPRRNTFPEAAMSQWMNIARQWMNTMGGFGM
ncbi:purpurin-like [Ylistrum balloti]|uniref:purpurin-like n=1 Tax=Ylistrum balloti TaxID=509963 RepID=UPI0029059FFE|nr:purpurin-like [Ylistrum balloti]